MQIVRGDRVWWCAALTALCCLLASGGCGGGGGGNGSGKSISQRIADAQSREPAQRARLLIVIAREQARAADSSGAKQTLNQAFQACKDIEEISSQADAYARLAQAQAEIGQTTEARNTAQLAMTAAEKIDSAELHAKAIASASRALSAAGAADKAVEALTKAEPLATKVDDATGRVQVLCEIASAYEKAGKSTEADRVLSEALNFAKGLPDEKSQSIGTATIALEQAANKRADAAKQSFAAALELARKASEPGDEVTALIEIADRLFRANDAKQANELLVEAEKKCAKVKAPDLQAQLLDRARKMMNKPPRAIVGT